MTNGLIFTTDGIVDMTEQTQQINGNYKLLANGKYGMQYYKFLLLWLDTG